MDLTHTVAVPQAVLRDPPAVKFIRDIPELDAHESQWNGLTLARGNPIADFDFNRSFAAVLETDQQLNVLTVGSPHLSGIAPLILSRRRLLTLLAAEMYEIQDFLYNDPSAAYDLACALSRIPYPLYLNRIAADSPTVAAIQKAYRRRGVVVIRKGAGSPWIPLDDSWLEPESQLNSGRRSDLRRARRNAEKVGPVSAEIIAPEPERLSVLVDEAFRVEAAGWKGAEGTALAKDPIRGTFFRRYLDLACRKGTLRIGFLRIGDRSVAAQIAIDNGQRFCLLRAGYDEEFARFSPGMLLTRETIAFAVRQKLQSYEFNGTVEPWTKIWTGHERPCCRIRAYPFSTKGLSKLASDTCSSTLSRVRKICEVSHAS